MSNDTLLTDEQIQERIAEIEAELFPPEAPAPPEPTVGQRAQGLLYGAAETSNPANWPAGLEWLGRVAIQGGGRGGGMATALGKKAPIETTLPTFSLAETAAGARSLLSGDFKGKDYERRLSEQEEYKASLPQGWIRGGEIAMIVAGLADLGITATSKLAPVVGNYLKKFGVSQARRGIGFTKGPIKAAGGVEEANKATTTLLQEGVLKGDIEQIAKNVSELRSKSGKLIGDTLKQLDAAGVEGLNGTAVIRELENTIIPKYGMTVDQFMNLPINKGLLKQYQSIKKTMAMPRFNQGKYEAMQNLKQIVGRRAFGKTPDLPSEEAYYIIKNAQDNAVVTAAPKISDPALADKFMKAKRAYSASMVADDAINSKAAAMAGNNRIGLTDWIAIGASLPSGSKIPIVVAKKILANPRAQSLIGRTSYGTGVGLSKVTTAGQGGTGLGLISVSNKAQEE